MKGKVVRIAGDLSLNKPIIYDPEIDPNVCSFFMKDEEHNNPYGMGELRSRMEWLAGWYDAKVETQGFDDVKSKLRQ